MRLKNCSQRELEVLDTVLRETADQHRLPVQRCTQADGPNEWSLQQWVIPSSLVALGDVPIVEPELVDCIKFRRPRVDEHYAEVTLELPHQVFHYRLRFRPGWGWRVLAEDVQGDSD